MFRKGYVGDVGKRDKKSQMDELDNNTHITFNDAVAVQVIAYDGVQSRKIQFNGW